MEALRALGVAAIVGFILIMAACALVGSIAVDRMGRTLGSLW